MRIGTLVAGVLAMAAGFGLAAVVIGWPALVVGGPIVFGGAVVVIVTWLTGMQQRHAREHEYARADMYGRTDPHNGYVAYDGGFEHYDEHADLQRGHDGWASAGDEETIDADRPWADSWAGQHPTNSDDGAADYGSAVPNESAATDSSSSDSGSSSSSDSGSSSSSSSD